MTPIEWSVRLETGEAIVDTQHKVLMSMINQVLAARTEIDQTLRDKLIKSGLDHFLNYANFHFQTEEDILELYESDHFADHCASHFILKTKIQDLVTKHNNGEDILDALLMYIKYWLQSHILTIDMNCFSKIQKHTT